MEKLLNWDRDIPKIAEKIELKKHEEKSDETIKMNVGALSAMSPEAILTTAILRVVQQ